MNDGRYDATVVGSGHNTRCSISLSFSISLGEASRGAARRPGLRTAPPRPTVRIALSTSSLAASFSTPPTVLRTPARPLWRG